MASNSRELQLHRLISALFRLGGCRASSTMETRSHVEQQPRSSVYYQLSAERWFRREHCPYEHLDRLERSYFSLSYEHSRPLIQSWSKVYQNEYSLVAIDPLLRLLFSIIIIVSGNSDYLNSCHWLSNQSKDELWFSSNLGTQEIKASKNSNCFHR